MDTRTLGVSLLGGLVAAVVVAVGLTEVLRDVIWPSAFVGIFVGFMTGVVVFAALYLFYRRDEGESESEMPAGGSQ